MTTLIQSLLKRSDLDYQTFTDSVSKFRVSTPESLIDTDFEYGLQSIKWETVQLVNNIPLFFSRSGDTPIPLVDVTTTIFTDYIYVTTSADHNLLDGAPIYIAGLKAVTAEGYFTVSKVLNSRQFVYKAKYTQSVSGSLYDANTSFLFPGMVYQGTSFTADQLEYANTDGQTISTITVQTVSPHGFSIGTNFSLSSTIGKREVTIDSVNLPSSTFTTTLPHSFYTGTQVTYSYDTGVAYGGLTNNTQYTFIAVSSNTFQLGNSTSPPITISSDKTVGSVHKITSVDDASDGSTYTITSALSSNTFSFQAPNTMLVNQYTLDRKTNIVQQSNIPTARAVFVTNTAHKAVTGTPVRYTVAGGAPLSGGLSSGSTYYAIRINENAFKLAATRADALNNIASVYVNEPVNSSLTSTHTFEFPSVVGEVRGNGTVTCSNGTNVVSANNTNFLSYFKKGDRFKIVLPIPTATAYSAASIASPNITLVSAAGIVTGTPLRYTGSGVGLTTSNVYYSRFISGTTITLHNSIDDSLNGINAIVVSSLTVPTATFSSVPLATTGMFESTVSQVNNSTTITLNTSNVTGSNLVNANYMIPSTIYPFADSYVYHRAHDGGIELIPSNNADAQLIRQTRKYFRYQPGKGIQCSLSVNFNAPLDIDYMWRSGTTANVRTRKPHRLSTGLLVTISGADQSAWNGTYQITVTSVNTFTFTLNTTPANNEVYATGYQTFTVSSWSGSALRAGLFDDQNGMFFEYDGSFLYAVRRDSVTQLSGLVNVWFGSNLVLKTYETDTVFRSQLKVKDNVVIRGQTYRVVNIPNDQSFWIQPAYRGATDQNVLVSKTTDVKVKRQDWNIDKCDGTGPTGYNLDVTKIQMIYMDYSWYGAGKIRFGFKDKKGEVRYVHEFIHNNSLNQAYFRSGNLPARYEVFNVGAPTWVPPLMHWGTAVIMDGRYDDDKAYLFTASGNILNFTNGDQIRVDGTVPNRTRTTTVYDPYIQKSTVAYNLLSTGTSSNTWSALQNIKTGTLVTCATPNILATNTFTVGTPQKDNANPASAIIYINPQPLNNTAGTVTFTFGDANDIIPNLIPLVSVRVAPSVDSSITGPLGVRELVNRMQLRLRSVDILTTNDTELRLILNGFISNRSFVNASPPSLSQYVNHVKGDTIQDGTVLFSYRVPGGIIDSAGKKTTTVTSYDISGLGYLGNSIQGGDNIYPDGPDVLTLVAVCLDPAGVSATTPYTVTARISWAEAQA